MQRRTKEELPTVEDVFGFIVQFKLENNGLSPTMQEIADAIGDCKSAVFRHIKTLEVEGKISLYGESRSARNIIVPSLCCKRQTVPQVQSTSWFTDEVMERWTEELPRLTEESKSMKPRCRATIQALLRTLGAAIERIRAYKEWQS